MSEPLHPLTARDIALGWFLAGFVTALVVTYALAVVAWVVVS